MDREKELALANIDKAEALIKKGIGTDIEAFVKVVNMLVIDCEKVGKIEKGKYYANKLIEYISENIKAIYSAYLFRKEREDVS